MRMSHPILTTFTLTEIKALNPCRYLYRRLRKSLGGTRKFGMKTPVAWTHILDLCGFEDCLSLLFVGGEAAKRVLALFALECAERVLPISEKWMPTDKRVRNCLEFLQREYNGQSTQADQAIADDILQDVVLFSHDAGKCEWDTGDADAWAAGYAAWAVVAAYAVVREGFNRTSKVASCAVESVVVSARSHRTGDAEKEWQIQRLRELLLKFSGGDGVRP